MGLWQKRKGFKHQKDLTPDEKLEVERDLRDLLCLRHGPPGAQGEDQDKGSYRIDRRETRKVKESVLYPGWSIRQGTFKDRPYRNTSTAPRPQPATGHRLAPEDSLSFSAGSLRWPSHSYAPWPPSQQIPDIGQPWTESVASWYQMYEQNPHLVALNQAERRNKPRRGSGRARKAGPPERGGELDAAAAKRRPRHAREQRNRSHKAAPPTYSRLPDSASRKGPLSRPSSAQPMPWQAVVNAKGPKGEFQPNHQPDEGPSAIPGIEKDSAIPGPADHPHQYAPHPGFAPAPNPHQFGTANNTNTRRNNTSKASSRTTAYPAASKSISRAGSVPKNGPLPAPYPAPNPGLPIPVSVPATSAPGAAWAQQVPASRVGGLRNRTSGQPSMGSSQAKFGQTRTDTSTSVYTDSDDSEGSGSSSGSELDSIDDWNDGCATVPPSKASTRSQYSAYVTPESLAPSDTHSNKGSVRPMPLGVQHHKRSLGSIDPRGNKVWSGEEWERVNGPIADPTRYPRPGSVASWAPSFAGSQTADLASTAGLDVEGRAEAARYQPGIDAAKRQWRAQQL